MNISGIDIINAEIKRVSKIVNSQKSDDGADCPFTSDRVRPVPEEEKRPAPPDFDDFMEKLKRKAEEGALDDH